MPTPSNGRRRTPSISQGEEQNTTAPRIADDACCRFLTKSAIPIPLTDAKKYYQPCKVCKPPE
ncbi:MAG TPA: hypothetical protein VFH95_15580 [Candidatus Kapabacteria bacterium]|nr:hypothetical protein [Candidatus Kapabacteria bacterium]